MRLTRLLSRARVLVTALGLCGVAAASSCADDPTLPVGGVGASGGGSGGTGAGGATGGAGGTATGGAGGASGTGGAGGAGGTGAAPAGGSGGAGGAAPCASLPLCDGFETGAGAAPDPALWTVVSPDCSGAGVVTIDETLSHSGRRSLKVIGAGGFCDHVFVANTAITSVGSVVWGRFYVRFTDPLGAGHVTFAAFEDTADAGKSLRMGGQNRILMWNRESDDATLPVLSPAGTALSVAPPAGEWLCVELMIDGATGAMSTYVDGVEIQGLHLDATPTPEVDEQWLRNASWRPELADLKLGWESYAGQAMTLWFDDVAIAAERIGCE